MLFVVGVGLGMFMQTLVLATQNSIAQSDMGVGTSAITFFRTLGGAIGASALGAILIARERSSVAGEIPSCRHIVASRSAGLIGWLATSVPFVSLAPWTHPPRIPPPAKTAL